MVINPTLEDILVTMNHSIKILVFLFVSLSYPNIGFSQSDSSVFLKIQKHIEEAKHRYAPDKRSKLVELKKVDISQNRYSIQSTEPEAINYLSEILKKENILANLVLLPDESVGNKKSGIVNLSVANLRTEPSHAAEMATQLLLGTQVDILQHVGGDYRVRTPEGYIAWVNSSSIVAMDEVQIAKWNKKEKLIYIQEFGRSYSTPTATSLRVSDLVHGNILALEGEETSYYRISYPDERIAFIPKNEAQLFTSWLNTRELTAKKVIASAKTMIGLPYLWGGTSVKGVDCSGFTKTSYFMNGSIIPRDASQQVLAGEAIDILDDKKDFDAEKALKNLQPADLIFFAASKGKRENPRVTHVGLYLGNGEFIHAAGTVRINSLLKEARNYDEFQTKTIVAARRYIDSKDPQIQAVSKSKYYQNIK